MAVENFSKSTIAKNVLPSSATVMQKLSVEPTSLANSPYNCRLCRSGIPQTQELPFGFRH